MFDRPMQFTTTGPNGEQTERMRGTASGLIIVWIDEWAADRIEWLGGVACAGHGTSIDLIEALFSTRCRREAAESYYRKVGIDPANPDPDGSDYHLPPGVTTLPGEGKEEQEVEPLADAIYEQLEGIELHNDQMDRVAERMLDFVSEKISAAYTMGYAQGMTDEGEANRVNGEQDGERENV